MEALWGQSPPPTAQRMLHNQVFALRQVLGRNGRLETHGSAYRLNVGPGERDVDRFEELVAAGRASMETDPERAAETLRQALDLWRGDALSDLAYESFAQTEIARLEERRWAAFEAWGEAELALGRHADLVAELEAAVAAQPLRERLHGQLMLALYRCGRQAEALEAYRAAQPPGRGDRRRAGRRLRALQAAILAQDAALESAARADGAAGRARWAAPRRWRDGRGSSPSSWRWWPKRVTGAGAWSSCRVRAASARHGWRRNWPATPCGAGWSSLHGCGRPAHRRTGRERGERRCSSWTTPTTRPAKCSLASPRSRGSSAPGGCWSSCCTGGPSHRRSSTGRRRAGSSSVPSGRDEVAEIARLYAPAGSGPLASDALAGESGGVPQAVHRLAAEWARARASDAIGASAGRATSERGELRSAEAELSEDLSFSRRWTIARGATGAETYRWRRVSLPGARPFDAAHAEYFFGRERLVTELVARLVGSPLVAVIGPSGSGKSSAVRAGLLPALAGGCCPDPSAGARR